MGDIFQNGDLSTAMSSRNTFSTAVGIVVTLLSAQIITKLPNTSAQTILLYQILLVITFILAQGEVISFFKFRGIRTIKKEEKTSNITAIVNIIKNVFKERKYRIFTLSSLVFHFGWQMGWPLFSIYTIDNLKADEMWLSLIAVSSSLASIIAYKKWAKFAKHKGNSYTLFIVTIGMSVTPLLYAVSRSLWALVFFNVIVGIFTAGTTQVLFNLLLEVTPNVNRTGYIAMYNTIMTASAIVSPMIGASIKNHTNIFVALIIVSCLRFIGCFGFRISNKLIGKKIVDV
jgi:Na+/melibiose symporter-like transporter